MKFWPLSALIDSQLVPWQYAGELYALQMRRTHDMSMPAVNACANAASRIKPLDMPSFTLAKSEDAVNRAACLNMPREEEFRALERCGVVVCNDEMWMMIASLH
jgi:hypothetical protein